MKSQTRKKKTKIGENNNRFPDKLILDPPPHNQIISNSMVFKNSKIEFDNDS